MRKTIEKIKQQPIHIRETVVWVSAISVFSLVALVWFADFQSDSYALLNPNEVQQDDTVIVENDSEAASPLAALITSLSNLKSGISGLLNGDNIEQDKDDRGTHILPLSK